MTKRRALARPLTFATGLAIAPSLAPQMSGGCTGTRWQIFEVCSGVLVLKCLGDVTGPQWPDGRTGDGTMGLVPHTATPDGGYDGTLWRVRSA